MARIIYPTDFTSQFTLLKNIKTKHDTDGADSVLTPYLTQQHIVLDDCVTDGNTAEALDNSQAMLHKQSENATQLRNINFKIIDTFTKDSAQFLKKLFKPNYGELGNWGIPVQTSGKISYPPDVFSMTTIGKRIITKSDSYAAGTSPLQAFLTTGKYTSSGLNETIGKVFDNDANSTAYLQQAENDIQERDTTWNPIMDKIKGMCGYLLTLYPSNPKTLGLYGINIDDSPRTPKTVTSTIKPLQQITISGVVIGSTFENIGNVEVHLYKGKSTTGTPTIVSSKQKYGMTAGWSVLTIINPSTTADAKITTLRTS